MPKAKNELVTAAGPSKIWPGGTGKGLAESVLSDAILDARPLENYMRKITDAQRSEELPGTFTGVIVRRGKITDVVAANGAVKIEE